MPQNGTARSGARKHISASSLAALECIPENENAEPVCYLSSMDAKEQCRALVSEIEIPAFIGAP